MKRKYFSSSKTSADMSLSQSKSKKVNALSIYANEIDNICLLSADEEIDLAHRIEKGDQKARKTLIEANLCLVVYIAKRYAGHGLPLLDVIQEGNIGLIKAAKKYDYRKKIKFSTYASWWIQRSIRRGLEQKSRIIRKPVYVEETMRQLRYAQRRLSKKYQREPTVAEISQEMQLSLKQVHWLLCCLQNPVSLDMPMEKEGYNKRGDCIEDGTFPSPSMYVLNQDLREQLKEMLEVLTELERKVLGLRFGLEKKYTYTASEISKMIGFPTKKVQQLENQAIRKLRHPTRRVKLKDFLIK